MSTKTQAPDTLTLVAGLAAMGAEQRAMLIGYLSGMVDSAVAKRNKEKAEADEKSEK